MNSILASVRFNWNKTEKTVAPEASHLNQRHYGKDVIMQMMSPETDPLIVSSIIVTGSLLMSKKLNTVK